MEPIITLKGVSKVYKVGNNHVRALDNIDLDILPGEFCLIVGRSGSGKSTLLNMLAGLEKPTKGSIRVAGKQLERMNEGQLVQFRLNNVGFIFQSFNLFAMHTALDNVAMPLTYKGMDKQKRTVLARKMLKTVGLQTHMMHKPNQMSGGQQQRVGIARALVASPKIIFADEPTGNLDLKTTHEILKSITDIAKERNTTLIMVTHDPSIAKYANRVVHILDGHVEKVDTNQSPAEIELLEELATTLQVIKAQPIIQPKKKSGIFGWLKKKNADKTRSKDNTSIQPQVTDSTAEAEDNQNAAGHGGSIT